MKSLQFCIFIIVFVASTAHGDDNDTDKIEYLLTSVGSSECVFIRNGNEHTSKDAEKHLRMKYRRGKRWATSTGSFISRIATKSSFSGKPYLMRCGEEEAGPTADWLRERLSEYPSTVRQ